MRVYSGGSFRAGLFNYPCCKRAICMRTHELFAFVVPADGAKRLCTLIAAVSHSCLQVPHHQLPGLEGYQ